MAEIKVGATVIVKKMEAVVVAVDSMRACVRFDDGSLSMTQLANVKLPSQERFKAWWNTNYFHIYDGTNVMAIPKDLVEILIGKMRHHKGTQALLAPTGTFICATCQREFPEDLAEKDSAGLLHCRECIMERQSHNLDQ